MAIDRTKLQAARDRWRAAHPDRVREQQRRHRAKHRDELLAKRRIYMAAYRAEHTDKIAADHAKYRATHQRAAASGGRGLPLHELGAHLDAALGRHQLYQAADLVVSRGLPRHARMDIISELVLAVLEGRLKVTELARHVKRFTRDHYAEFRHVSLNTAVPGREKTLLIDTIRSDAEHF